MFAFPMSRVTGLSKHFDARCLVSRTLHDKPLHDGSRSQGRSGSRTVCCALYVLHHLYRNVVISRE